MSSPFYSKQVVTFTARVFIEATEFADVLMTAGLPVAQGAETPTELSNVTDSTCGQAWTTTFYMELLDEAPAEPAFVPPGSSEGLPFPNLSDPAIWHYSWSWRRSFCAGNTSLDAVNVGDITQQNYGNDLDSGYAFLDIKSAQAQKPWKGGLNITVLQMLENRSYGYFHAMVNSAPDPTWKTRLVLNYTTSGTLHGLSKMPYLRDSRRAIGLDGYRLSYPFLDFFNATGDCRVSFLFEDAIALGEYNDDTHILHTCELPSYIINHTTKPYWLPFRALTVAG